MASIPVLVDIDLNSNRVTNSSDPVSNQDLVTKVYSDRRDYHQVVQKLDVEINDTIDFQVYLSNNFALPELGDYLVTIDLKMSHDSAGNDIILESVINGTRYRFTRDEFQDAAGIGIDGTNVNTGNVDNTGTDQIKSASDTFLLSNVSGNIPVSLEWAAQTAPNESTIHRATIQMKRVNI